MESKPINNYRCVGSQCNRIMWVYFEHLASLLENVAQVLRLTSSDDIERLKREHRGSVYKKTSVMVPTSSLRSISLPVTVDLPDVIGKKILHQKWYL